MEIDEIIEKIISGIGDKEDPADVLYLCNTMAIVLYARRRRVQDQAALNACRQEANQFGKALRLAGKILCVIFSAVKPADYSNEMKETRKSYKGVANDRKMQAKYFDKVKKVAEEGKIDSLKRAIEARVWELIR